MEDPVARRCRRFAQQLIRSQRYRDDLEMRLYQGKLHPAVETMLWHYAAGKPREKIEVYDRRSKDLHSMTREELASYLAELQQALSESTDTVTH